MNVDEITELIESDRWMMDVLRAAEALDLPDWWIGAGFLRNKVWDAIEGNEYSTSRDVDLVYFDAEDVKDITDWAYDEKMKKEYPFAEWEVRNQARMHQYSHLDPFVSTEDGISHWVETATCVAVKLHKRRLKFIFCHGTDDLFNLVARPTRYFQTEQGLKTFYGRIEKKEWKKRWPSLKVVEK